MNLYPQFPHFLYFGTDFHVMPSQVPTTVNLAALPYVYVTLHDFLRFQSDVDTIRQTVCAHKYSVNRRSDSHTLPELPAILATFLARYQHTMLLRVAAGHLKTNRSCAGSKIMHAIIWTALYCNRSSKGGW